MMVSCIIQLAVILLKMEDIDAQQNISEFSVQAFRKICDALVISPPKSMNEATDRDEKRFRLLDALHRKVLEYAGQNTDDTTTGERPGEFMQKLGIIEALGKYWHVYSMNLETILDEFVFNAIDRKRQ